MIKTNSVWENGCLFALANIGDVNLFEYWANKKNININIQDQGGDTDLHWAVREDIKIW